MAEATGQQTRWATKKDLADHLQVGLSTIDELMKSGLPFVKLGRCVRYNVAAVDAFLEARQQGVVVVTTHPPLPV